MNIALVVAGGTGSRMQSGRRKQYLELQGVPVVVMTLRVFDASALINRIVLVVPEDDLSYCRDDLIAKAGFTKPVELVAGGRTRQGSVLNGLQAMAAADDDLVVIHDAVRPFLQASELAACIETAAETGACILALKAFDTLKKTGPDGRISTTLDRKSVWLAQTPQVFRYGKIHAAHVRAKQAGIEVTDDAALLEMADQPVSLVPGSRQNIKITTPEDLALAVAIASLNSTGRNR